MENRVIQDYGKTIDPEIYTNALQGHQYIPQADQCIRNIIKKHCQKNEKIPQKILDLGCGPGRLTFSLVEGNNCHILGLDISNHFIEYARKSLHLEKARHSVISFRVGNFATDSADDEVWDVILMQGVMHHIQCSERFDFLQNCFNSLRSDGILIIGDEFIAEYKNEDERRLNAGKFYLHIIDEARKGGFDELAEEEAKNLIDDILSGEEGAGFGDEPLFQAIYEKAELFNRGFYSGAHKEISELTKELIGYAREKTQLIARKDIANFNRGDYKVSVEHLTREFTEHNFVLEQAYKIGPVDVLGGMGVLIFKKQ